MQTIFLRDLKLSKSIITSASSLLNVNGRVFTCCDDQYGLYELKHDQIWLHHPWPKAPILPLEKNQLKKLKPDFEALINDAFEKDVMILIPSGSKNNRSLALKFDLVKETFTEMDMSEFFTDLSQRVPKINIEGGTLFNGRYLFMNRGVGNSESSMIEVDPKDFKIISITPLNFGAQESVSMHGSELFIFEEDLYVLAVAEASENSYDDGEVMGSLLVRLSLKENFKILNQWIFDRKIKAEGLCRFSDQWLLSTDSDGLGPASSSLLVWYRKK